MSSRGFQLYIFLYSHYSNSFTLLMTIGFSINHAKVCNKQAIYTSLLQGDTGGGAVFGNTIYGVISFTGVAEKDDTKFVGFMDICEYKDWIKTTTKKGFFSFG